MTSKDVDIVNSEIVQTSIYIPACFTFQTLGGDSRDIGSRLQQYCLLDLLDNEEIVVEDTQGFEEYCFQGSDDELPDIAW